MHPSKSHFSTPSKDSVFSKQPGKPLIFNSPDWQNKKIFQDAERSQTPTPTTLSFDRRKDESSEASSWISIPDRSTHSTTSGSYQPQRDAVKRESSSDRSGEDDTRTHIPRKKLKSHITRVKTEPKAPKSFRAEKSSVQTLGFNQKLPKKQKVEANLEPHKKHLASSAPNWSNNSRSASTSPVPLSQSTGVTPKETPSTKFAVVLPPRGESASRSLLDKFRRSLPRSKDRGSTSSTLKEAKRSRETFLLAELKKDTSIARSRASTVEEVFGSHGLSNHYDNTATDDAQRKALAQKKAKKVKRSTIKLDWGQANTENIPFDPADFIPPAEQAKHLLDAKFEDVPGGASLTFLNDRNDRRIDGKFQFVNSYIRKGLKRQITPQDFGCFCSTDCNPQDTGCRCLRTPDGSKIAPYVRRQDGLVTLSPSFIDSIDGGTRQEIFECNDACLCSSNCLNRVVQKGRTTPLQIFMTPHCGFGIRSPQPIKRGQFIDVYLGELLTTKAIEEYESTSTEKSCSYVFSLDFFGEASYHIQGLHFGSPTRFINHSCNPNTRIFTVMMNHADQKIYKLAYFAIRDIPAMKEITFDYSPETANEEPWVPTPGVDDEAVVRCMCGERNCRGRIWPKRQAARRKGRGWARK